VGGVKDSLGGIVEERDLGENVRSGAKVRELCHFMIHDLITPMLAEDTLQAMDLAERSAQRLGFSVKPLALGSEDGRTRCLGEW
jgi:hypothetical protein